ncbi:MAG: TatD family hydrolase [Candidatus Thermoplasmatota archaeon]|jgi:TatD-related deoxyribonuclease|nr:TatD family hydrolase [Candidatus Thermoplasmatota archaeon]
MMDRIFDNHFHLNYGGNFLESARRFKKAGGTAINLTNLPDYSIPVSSYYETLYQRTISMAEKIRRDLDLDVVVTIGPYPLDIMNLSKDITTSEKIVREGMVRAARLCDMGKANAVGEIGRPHFTVKPEVLEKSNEILDYAFSLCKDSGVPAILHTEDLDDSALRDLEKRIRDSGMKDGMVVKHHARPENLLRESSVRMSIPATRTDLRSAIGSGNYFLMETDFIDNPEKPDMFLPPDSVPKRAIWIKQEFGEKGQDILDWAFTKIPDLLFGEENFS